MNIPNKGAQISKKAKQEYFELIMRHSSTGIGLVTPEGHYIKANKALCDYLGYTTDELMKIGFGALTYKEDECEIEALHSRLMSGEIDSYNVKKRYIHKHEHTVWGMLTVSLVRDEAGAPQILIKQIQDITATVESECKKENQVRELALLTQKIAHEFKNPIGNMEHLLGYIEQAADDNDIALVKNMASIGHSTAKQLTSLSYNLLDAALMEKTKQVASFNVSELFVDCLIMQKNKEDSCGINFVFDQLQNLEISTNKTAMSLIFNNLISNAIKFKDPCKEKSHLIVNMAIEDNTFSVWFVDNGFGMSCEQLAQLGTINTRFHKDYATGSGLGIYLVKRAADIIGADISFEQNEQQGISIMLTMPMT